MPEGVWEPDPYEFGYTPPPPEPDVVDRGDEGGLVRTRQEPSDQERLDARIEQMGGKDAYRDYQRSINELYEKQNIRDEQGRLVQPYDTSASIESAYGMPERRGARAEAPPPREVPPIVFLPGVSGRVVTARAIETRQGGFSELITTEGERFPMSREVAERGVIGPTGQPFEFEIPRDAFLLPEEYGGGFGVIDPFARYEPPTVVIREPSGVKVGYGELRPQDVTLQGRMASRGLGAAFTTDIPLSERWEKALDFFRTWGKGEDYRAAASAEMLRGGLKTTPVISATLPAWWYDVPSISLSDRLISGGTQGLLMAGPVAAGFIGRSPMLTFARMTEQGAPATGATRVPLAYVTEGPATRQVFGTSRLVAGTGDSPIVIYGEGQSFRGRPPATMGELLSGEYLRPAVVREGFYREAPIGHGELLQGKWETPGGTGRSPLGVAPPLTGSGVATRVASPLVETYNPYAGWMLTPAGYVVRQESAQEARPFVMPVPTPFPFTAPEVSPVTAPSPAPVIAPEPVPMPSGERAPTPAPAPMPVPVTVTTAKGGGGAGTKPPDKRAVVPPPLPVVKAPRGSLPSAKHGAPSIRPPSRRLYVTFGKTPDLVAYFPTAVFPSKGTLAEAIEKTVEEVSTPAGRKTAITVGRGKLRPSGITTVRQYRGRDLRPPEMGATSI